MVIEYGLPFTLHITALAARPVVTTGCIAEYCGRQADNLPFLQILPIIVCLFFCGTDSTDSPDCLPILLGMSVFLLFSFSVFVQ